MGGTAWPLFGSSLLEVCNAGHQKGDGGNYSDVDTSKNLTVQKGMVLFSLNVTTCLLLQLMGSWHPWELERPR